MATKAERTLSDEEFSLFEQFKAREQEKKARASAALAYAEKVKVNADSRPDYEDDDAKEMWDSCVPGVFAEVWTMDTGLITGLCVQDQITKFIKGEQKGEIKSHTKQIYIHAGFDLEDGVGLRHILGIEYGEVSEVGNEFKMPKKIS